MDMKRQKELARVEWQKEKEAKRRTRSLEKRTRPDAPLPEVQAAAPDTSVEVPARREEERS